MVLLGRRSFIRADIKSEFQFRRSGEDWQAVTSRDISVDGVAFYSALPLRLDEHIEIVLPADWGKQAITAKIVHIQDGLIGCQFSDISPEAAQVLSNIVYTVWQQSLRHSTAPTGKE